MSPDNATAAVETDPVPQPRSLTDTKPNLYIKKGAPQRLSPTVGFSELIPAIC
jgi:hypothetical protein